MFSFIAHKPKGLDYRVIHQTKARFCFYLFVIDNYVPFVTGRKYEIKTEFFTFSFCANASSLILNPQQ